MGVARAAVGLVLIGIVGVAVGVGAYDWRAGLITFSVLSAAVGAWHLLTQE